VAIFRRRDLVATCVIPIAGDLITSDIATALYPPKTRGRYHGERLRRWCCWFNPRYAGRGLSGDPRNRAYVQPLLPPALNRWKKSFRSAAVVLRDSGQAAECCPRHVPLIGSSPCQYGSNPGGRHLPEACAPWHLNYTSALSDMVAQNVHPRDGLFEEARHGTRARHKVCRAGSAAPGTYENWSYV
jgi:hypothetical protein